MAAPATKKRKRVPHAPDTGQFEGYTPFNTPALLDYAVKTIRAIDHLEPIFRALANGQSELVDAKCSAALHMTLAAIRSSMVEALSVDKAALKEALKPELQASRFIRAKGGA